MVEPGKDSIAATAKQGAPDHYAAWLLAPAGQLRDLLALAALVAEISRIADAVSDPMAGEVRLQWWRDAIGAGLTGCNSGNPVADRFSAVMSGYGLSGNDVHAYLDAHAEALYPAPPDDDAVFLARLDTMHGLPFRFAAQILGGVAESAAADALQRGGRAYGLMRVAAGLPQALARERNPIPPERSRGEQGVALDWSTVVRNLAAASAREFGHLRAIDCSHMPAIRMALLPVAVVPAHLRALRSPRHRADRDLIEITPLSRFARVAWVNWTGRF
jgi:15-cis-phytoene synthase